MKLQSPSPSQFTLKNLFFLVCIFYSSGAITFYSSPWGHGFLILFSLLLVFKYVNNRKLIIPFLTWFIYCLVLIIIYNDDLELTINHFVRYSTLILASYTLIKLYDFKLFYRYEQIVVFLAKISLIFWLWLILSPHSLQNFASTFHIGTTANNPFRSSEFYYMIFYAVEYFSYKSEIISRNYGFCLEPVIFACFLVFALFFNIMRNGGIKIRRNMNFLILLITLFTTFSTTGLLTFMVFVIYYLIFNKQLGIKRYLIFIPVFALLVAAFFYLDFLYPKISAEYSGLSDFDRIAKISSSKMRLSAGRLGGLIIGWQDFRSHPIIGIGANGLRSFAYKGGAALMNTYGFAGIM